MVKYVRQGFNELEDAEELDFLKHVSMLEALVDGDLLLVVFPELVGEPDFLILDVCVRQTCIFKVVLG